MAVLTLPWQRGVASAKNLRVAPSLWGEALSSRTVGSVPDDSFPNSSSLCGTSGRLWLRWIALLPNPSVQFSHMTHRKLLCVRILQRVLINFISLKSKVVNSVFFFTPHSRSPGIGPLNAELLVINLLLWKPQALNILSTLISLWIFNKQQEERKESCSCLRV